MQTVEPARKRTPAISKTSGTPLAYRKSPHDTQTTTQHGSKRHCERVRSEHTPSTLSAVHALYANVKSAQAGVCLNTIGNFCNSQKRLAAR